jgi:hypothetical protein
VKGFIHSKGFFCGSCFIEWLIGYFVSIIIKVHLLEAYDVVVVNSQRFVPVVVGAREFDFVVSHVDG